MSRTTNINQNFSIKGTEVTLTKDNGKTLYNIENDTFSALNDFNTKYANYLRCSKNLGLRTGENGNPAISTVMDSSEYYNNKIGCSSDIPEISDVIDSKNNLENQITIYENAIALFDTSNMLGQKTVKNNIQTYENNLEYIKKTHSEIIQKRNEYDVKLEKLKNIDKDVKSSVWDSAIQKEQEILYVGTVGAILATTVLYYFFIKI